MEEDFILLCSLLVRIILDYFNSNWRVKKENAPYTQIQQFPKDIKQQEKKQAQSHS